VKNTAYKIGILILLATVFLFGSCIHDDFDEPEIQDIPTGNVLTIGDLRQMYIDSVQSGMYPEGYKFSKDYSVYCACTMDDKKGNIYKSAYVQDETGAINLHLMSSGGIYQGDSVRLFLNGLILGDYENMLQLDSVHVDENIVKIATDCEITPEEVEIGQIQTGAYQGELIKLTNVQFIEDDIGKTFADTENLLTENRTIENCDGQQMTVRTSGYADFASYRVPEGRGSLIAIVGQFRDEWQLYLRSYYELNMDGLRCGVYDTVFSENFNSADNGQLISLEGWYNISTAGILSWKAKTTGRTVSAIIDGRDASESSVESWLISPAILLQDGDHAMDFVTRAAYDKNGTLQVMISTDYDGNTPDNSNWTEVTADISDGPVSGYAPDWTLASEVDLSDYTNEEVYIAFKYTGSNVESTLFLLDDVIVYRQ
jgi:hypothetical protein